MHAADMRDAWVNIGLKMQDACQTSTSILLTDHILTYCRKLTGHGAEGVPLWSHSLLCKQSSAMTAGQLPLNDCRNHTNAN